MSKATLRQRPSSEAVCVFVPIYYNMAIKALQESFPLFRRRIVVYFQKKEEL